MPSSRRAFLSAALAAAAGCSGSPSEREPPPSTGSPTADGRTPPTTDGSTARGSDGTTRPPDVAEITRWSYVVPSGAVGSLTLAPGAGRPAVYVGSATSGGSGQDATETDGWLAAVSLQDGGEQWTVSLPTPPTTAPTYGGDDGPPRVYLGTGRASLHGEAAELQAIDPERGTRAWRFDTEDRRFVYPLTASDAAVFVGRRDDQLGPGGEFIYALGADDGTEQWRITSGDAADDGHAVRRETLVVKTHRRLRALDPASGEGRWHVGADGPIDGPVYGSHGERVFLGMDGVVRGLGLLDGAALWRREFDFPVSRVTRPEEALSTTVHVADADGRLLALGPLDGTTRWTYEVEAERFHPTVERTSESLFVDGAGVHCLDPVSGERRWSFEPDVEGTVRARASTTVFATGGGSVWALDPERGDVRWEFSPEAGIEGVASAGDFAFVASGGTVRALDGGRGS